jgi:uncharacterized membrane protein YeaQ/YmgE (transglycosylase-associated protein family)
MNLSYQLILPILTGLLLGTWPMILRQTGMDGFQNAILLMIGQGLLALPLLPFIGRTSAEQTLWWPVAISAVIGLAAIVMFNVAIQRSPERLTGKIVVVMLVAHLVAPTIYTTFIHDGLSAKTTLGLVGALVTIVCLT